MDFITYSSGNTNIIFLHGWGADSSSFLWLKDKLQNFSLHFANLDGFGGQSAPDDPSIVGYAQRLHNYIIGNSLQNVILVGHSFGGRVAIEYASKYPLHGLVLVDSAGLKPRFSLKKKLKIWHYKIIKKLVNLGAVKEQKLAKFGSPDYKSCDEKLKKVLTTAVNYDQTPLLGKITAPTLIYWGKNDADTPLYMAKKLNKKIKGSGLVVVEGAGHFSFLDNDAQFCKTIDYFACNV